MSFPVKALTCDPSASKASEISNAVRVGVPLNCMCSMKWEMPSSLSLSNAAPVPTRMPIVTESSPSMRLTMTLIPFSKLLLSTIGISCFYPIFSPTGIVLNP